MNRLFEVNSGKYDIPPEPAWEQLARLAVFVGACVVVWLWKRSGLL